MSLCAHFNSESTCSSKGSHGTVPLQVQARAMHTPGVTASPRPPLRTSHFSCPRARRRALGSGLREVGTCVLLLAPGHPPRPPSPPNNGSSVPAGSSALESDRIPRLSARQSRRPPAPLPAAGPAGEGAPHPAPGGGDVTPPPPARRPRPCSAAPSRPADPRGARQRE